MTVRTVEDRMRGACDAFALVADDDLADQLVAADTGLGFPDGADDVLSCLGALGPLRLTRDEEALARAMTADLIDANGSEWVWQHRTRLRIELAWAILL